MPLVSIQTSVLLPDGEKEGLSRAASEMVSRILGKPEKYLMSIVGEGVIAMGGLSVPGAFVEVRSIGGLGAEKNVELAAALCELVSEALDVRPENIYLNFIDVQPMNWGWKGQTFG
jgi:phenylpyruvate tautomerase